MTGIDSDQVEKLLEDIEIPAGFMISVSAKSVTLYYYGPKYEIVGYDVDEEGRTTCGSINWTNHEWVEIVDFIHQTVNDTLSLVNV